MILVKFVPNLQKIKEVKVTPSQKDSLITFTKMFLKSDQASEKALRTRVIQRSLRPRIQFLRRLRQQALRVRLCGGILPRPHEHGG